VRAIRAEGLPNIPIQVIAGHSHRRLTATVDPRAGVFEPGNYFNTIGFASFDLPPPTANSTDVGGQVDTATGTGPGTETGTDTGTEPDAKNLPSRTSAHLSAINFSWVDLDTSTVTMATALGLPSAATLPTNDGVKLAAQIAAARRALNLTNILGCARQTFDEGAQLGALYFGKVLPAALFTPPRNRSQWCVQSTGSLRYSLFKGNVTVDDIFKILPFEDQFFVVERLLGSHIRELWARLNGDDGRSQTSAPELAQVAYDRRSGRVVAGRAAVGETWLRAGVGAVRADNGQLGAHDDDGGDVSMWRGVHPARQPANRSRGEWQQPVATGALAESVHTGPSTSQDRAIISSNSSGSSNSSSSSSSSSAPSRPGLGKGWGCTDAKPSKEERHDCIFATFDVPVVLAALKAVTGVDYQAKAFRPGETDTTVMTAWAAAALGGKPCPTRTT
jgi:hypothetical protein